MHFLDVTLDTLAENLALDEALLLEAEAARGGEVLRFWEWPWPAVVLGASGKVAEEVDERMCQQYGVPIARRASGGGTVLLGAGCLLYSLVLNHERVPELAEIRSSYCYIFGRIRAALADAAPGIECAGTSDLAVAGRKVSGNAQQRKRRHFLHHGSLLYALDLSQVGRFLRQPPRQPEYRGGRAHADFLTNLPLSAAEIKQRLRVAWHPDVPMAALPAELIRELATSRYSQDEWTRRR